MSRKHGTWKPGDAPYARGGPWFVGIWTLYGLGSYIWFPHELVYQAPIEKDMSIKFDLQKLIDQNIQFM